MSDEDASVRGATFVAIGMLSGRLQAVFAGEMAIARPEGDVIPPSKRRQKAIEEAKKMGKLPGC